MILIVCLLAFLAIGYLLLSLAFTMIACRRFPPKKSPLHGLTHATQDLLAPYAQIIAAGQEWIDTSPFREVTLRSLDGLRLHARLYENKHAKAVLVACHGYRSNGRRDFSASCPYYYAHGLSVLLIDERATGKSEGRYITFGVRESDDIRLWCEQMREIFPSLPVVLAGISMGASSVLMASDSLPDNVRAILADCGYDSPREQLKYVARRFMPRLSILFLPGVELLCRIVCGFSLRKSSACAHLANCQLPVFFVHGTADGLVPYGDSLKNQSACAGESELFLVPGAEHGMSYLVDMDGYRQRLERFLRAHGIELRQKNGQE